MNTSNIKNYKPKDFAELIGVSVKTLQRWDRKGILNGLRKYKSKIKEEYFNVKELQDGNPPDC